MPQQIRVTRGLKTETYEERSPEVWDHELASTREFINFGSGYTFARLISTEHLHVR